MPLTHYSLDEILMRGHLNQSYEKLILASVPANRKGRCAVACVLVFQDIKLEISVQVLTKTTFA